ERSSRAKSAVTASTHAITHRGRARTKATKPSTAGEGIPRGPEHRNRPRAARRGARSAAVLGPPWPAPVARRASVLQSAPSPPPPHRPLPMRMLNGAGRALARAGFARPRLDEERLLAAARRRARLEDFGPESFRPGLRRLVESLERDAALNQIGRLFAQRQI